MGTFFAVALVSVGCSPAVQGETRSFLSSTGSARTPDPLPLRTLAARRGLMLGAALSAPALRNDPAYRNLVAREYDLAVPENAMKFAETEPAPGHFDFQAADLIAAFARDHQMELRGHTLVWHQSVPAWLLAMPEQAGARLDLHISGVVGHFRTQVYAWDVVNEALDDHGRLRDDFWNRALGEGYLARAFRDAHDADPGALLYYNDYGTERPGSKQDGEYQLVASLLRQGVPVQGVGFQMHVGLEMADHLPELATTLRRFAALGVQVQITELDVRLPMIPSTADLARQAQVYQGVLTICLHQPACTALLTWGVTDRYTFQKGARPLPFDEQLQPKPAAEAMRVALDTP